MVDNFAVNTDGLASPASGLEDLATKINRIVSQHQANLDQLGEPWGDDKGGEQFFKQYGSPRDQVSQGVGSMINSSFGVAKMLINMRNGLVNTEQNAVEAANNLFPGAENPVSSDLRPHLPSTMEPNVQVSPRISRLSARDPEIPAGPTPAADATAATAREPGESLR